ncbi:MAG: hypothetical protein L6R40_006814 [Gallowayella cf. fulva]|nr:MAG: hypothetical protein L6R40_006814 [Xanthomendoza cf. fulva]
MSRIELWPLCYLVELQQSWLASQIIKDRSELLVILWVLGITSMEKVRVLYKMCRNYHPNLYTSPMQLVSDVLFGNEKFAQDGTPLSEAVAPTPDTEMSKQRYQRYLIALGALFDPLDAKLGAPIYDSGTKLHNKQICHQIPYAESLKCRLLLKNTYRLPEDVKKRLFGSYIAAMTTWVTTHSGGVRRLYQQPVPANSEEEEEDDIEAISEGSLTEMPAESSEDGADEAELRKRRLLCELRYSSMPDFNEV